MCHGGSNFLFLQFADIAFGVPLFGVANPEQKKPEWNCASFDPDELDGHLLHRLKQIPRCLPARLAVGENKNSVGLRKCPTYTK